MKGRRLIILNAIGEDAPLVEINLDTSCPIDDLKWKGGICHPQKRDDRQLTVEMFWDTQSHTGEYNDNMNSELFMLWVEQNSQLFCQK